MTVDPSCRRQNNKKLNWFLISSWNRVLNNKLNNSNCQPRLAIWLCKVIWSVGWMYLALYRYTDIWANICPVQTLLYMTQWEELKCLESRQSDLLDAQHKEKKKNNSFHKAEWVCIGSCHGNILFLHDQDLSQCTAVFKN